VLEALERNDIYGCRRHLRSSVRALVRVEVGLDPETTNPGLHRAVSGGLCDRRPSTSAHVEDHEAHESDRRMATTFVRLVAISVPLAAAVVYFGLSGRQARTPKRRPPRRSRRRACAEAEHRSAPRHRGRQHAGARRIRFVADNAARRAGGRSPDGRSDGEASVWVTATVDGRRTINRLLQPGETTTMEGPQRARADGRRRVGGGAHVEWRGGETARQHRRRRHRPAEPDQLQNYVQNR